MRSHAIVLVAALAVALTAGGCGASSGPSATPAGAGAPTINASYLNQFKTEVLTNGAGFPLYVFQPRPEGAGVSVSVKGKRVLIRHAFIATMPNGHVGIFARGRYGAHFQFGAGTHHVQRKGKSTELPIAELYTWAPADALGNPITVAAMSDRVEEQAAKVLERNLRFAIRGG